MQLREEVRTFGTKECPVNDYMCKYFENGVCRLQNPEKICTNFKKEFTNKKKQCIINK